MPFARQATRAAVAAAMFGCSNAQSYDAYDGPPAYPNRRPRIEGGERQLGYVSNSLSDTVSVLDLGAWESLAELPVGRDPVDIDGPHHLAVDAAQGSVYVALSYPTIGATGPHAGHGGSVRFGYVQRLALDDLRPLGEVRVDQNPGDVVLSPDGTSLAVTHYDLLRAQTQTALEARRAALVLIEPDLEFGERAAVTHVSVCIAPHGVTYAADSARLFVACTGEDSVAVVDRASASVVARVPVADNVGSPGSPLHEPYSAVLSPTGDALAVTNIGSNSLVLFDVAEELERRATTSLLGPAYFPAWTRDGARLIVPFQNPAGAALVDAETAEIVAQTEYAASDCQNPHEAVVTRSGDVFLVCEGDHERPGTVCAVDPETLEVTGKVEVGVFPDRLVVTEP